MTRRHDALIPLTHDHHHALHQLRLLSQAADGSDDERTAAALAFAAFFREHSVAHFREEEEEIFPLVIEHSECPTDAIERILVEHVRLHAQVRTLAAAAERGSVEPSLMTGVSDLLRAHIRFEEDELFPAIEQLAPAELGGVRLSERKRRDGA